MTSPRLDEGELSENPADMANLAMSRRCARAQRRW